MEPREKILIVEDELSLLEALGDKFRHEGFESLVAKNGKEGLAVAIEKQPDLILLDIVMPVMDGMTMMRKLREHSEYGKHVPIILLTNLSADDDTRMKSVAEYEPSFYLVKADWTIDKVVEKVREVLKL